MEVNCTVGVVDDYSAFGSYFLEVNCSFTASSDNLTLNVNICKSEIAVADTISHNEVAVNCYILKSYALASDNNRTFSCNGCIFTLCTYVSSENVMEKLCEFFSCDIVLRSDGSVFVTIYITFINHTCNSLYSPCINFASVRELIENRRIISVNKKYSCKRKNNIFPLHESIGVK